MFHRSGSESDASYASALSSSSSTSSSSTTSTSKGEKTRVYVTSLKSITSSSPTKTSWSAPSYNNSSATSTTAPPSQARRGLCRLLWSRRTNSTNAEATAKHNDDEPIISDSISNSRRLQNSIMSLTDNSSFDTGDTDDHTAQSTNNEQVVVHCCKLNEAKAVISTLQSRATTQINSGNLPKALEYLNRSLALQQKLHGKTHPEVASTLNKIGELLSNMNGTNGEDYKYMALSALEESLAIRQDLNESGTEETAITLKNMWCLLHEANVAISGEGESLEFQDMN